MDPGGHLGHVGQPSLALDYELSRSNHALASPTSSRWPLGTSGLSSMISVNTHSNSVPPKPTKVWTKPNPYNHGWRKVVRNFTPSWFAVTMGTGVVGILLDFIPFHARWLYYLSIGFFGLNTLIFFACLFISLLRYTIWPEIWSVMIHDPSNSLFLGTFPMGMATLIQLWTSICVPLWGGWALTFAWVLWIVNAVISVSTAVSIPFLLMSTHPIKHLESINAVQLLPIVAPIVACGTGAKVAAVLTNHDQALGTVLACYVLWGMSVPLALMVLVIYYHRLALHKLPAREAIVSCFLPLGPMGMGGFSIMLMGSVAKTLFPEIGFLHPDAGTFAFIFGFFIALCMWSFGLMWLCFALATIWKSRPFPFNMGWWGFTFPLGVFSASTIQLGKEMPSIFFSYLGTVFSVCVIILWVIVAIGTIREVWSGRLFNAPCLVHLTPKQRGEKAVEGDRQV